MRFPPGVPDHHYSPGCCSEERAFHVWSEQESREVGEWLNTEPGMIMRLGSRRRALQRMLELGAPEIILENQRRLIREMENKLSLGEGETP